MWVKCDGENPLRLRSVEGGGFVPCDCGRYTDDEQQLILYPHLRLAFWAIERYAYGARQPRKV